MLFRLLPLLSFILTELTDIEPDATLISNAPAVLVKLLPALSFILTELTDIEPDATFTFKLLNHQKLNHLNLYVMYLILY